MSDPDPSASSICVAVRVRPFTVREAAQMTRQEESTLFLGDGSLAGVATPKLNTRGLRSVIRVIDDKCLIFDPPEDNPVQRFSRTVVPGKKTKDQTFGFDRIFDQNATQTDVYEATTKKLLDSVLDGYNATVFAYGATGCGKTHTITGTPQQPGIIFLTMQELFEKIEDQSQEKVTEISLSYLEIYNETIRDLLVPGGGTTAKQGLMLREDSNQAVTVAGLTSYHPKNVQEVMDMIVRGNEYRTVSPTMANAVSSRSHAVLQINVAQKDRNAAVNEPHTMATLSIIDLAGSERASATKNRGERLIEGANINKSLLALGSCINALCDPRKHNHVPYRNSKLTRLLKFSLGGNCKTVMIVCVSPSSAHYDETQNTLRYANRAKNIQTKVTRNVYNVDRHVKDYLVKINEQLALITELKAQQKDAEKTFLTKYRKQAEKRDGACREGLMRLRAAYENAAAERAEKIANLRRLKAFERRIALLRAWIDAFESAAAAHLNHDAPDTPSIPHSLAAVRKMAEGIMTELEHSRHVLHQKIDKSRWERALDTALGHSIKQLPADKPSDAAAETARLRAEADRLKLEFQAQMYREVVEQEKPGDAAMMQVLLAAQLEMIMALNDTMGMSEEDAVARAKQIINGLLETGHKAVSHIVKPDGALLPGAFDASGALSYAHLNYGFAKRSSGAGGGGGGGLGGGGLGIGGSGSFGTPRRARKSGRDSLGFGSSIGHNGLAHPSGLRLAYARPSIGFGHSVSGTNHHHNLFSASVNSQSGGGVSLHSGQGQQGHSAYANSRQQHQKQQQNDNQGQVNGQSQGSGSSSGLGSGSGHPAGSVENNAASYAGNSTTSGAETGEFVLETTDGHGQAGPVSIPGSGASLGAFGYGQGGLVPGSFSASITSPIKNSPRRRRAGLGTRVSVSFTPVKRASLARPPSGLKRSVRWRDDEENGSGTLADFANTPPRFSMSPQPNESGEGGGASLSGSPRRGLSKLGLGRSMAEEDEKDNDEDKPMPPPPMLPSYLGQDSNQQQQQQHQPEEQGQEDEIMTDANASTMSCDVSMTSVCGSGSGSGSGASSASAGVGGVPLSSSSGSLRSSNRFAAGFLSKVGRPSVSAGSGTSGIPSPDALRTLANGVTGSPSSIPRVASPRHYLSTSASKSSLNGAVSHSSSNSINSHYGSSGSTDESRAPGSGGSHYGGHHGSSGSTSSFGVSGSSVNNNNGTSWSLSSSSSLPTSSSASIIRSSLSSSASASASSILATTLPGLSSSVLLRTTRSRQSLSAGFSRLPSAIPSSATAAASSNGCSATHFLSSITPSSSTTTITTTNNAQSHGSESDNEGSLSPRKIRSTIEAKKASKKLPPRRMSLGFVPVNSYSNGAGTSTGTGLTIPPSESRRTSIAASNTARRSSLAFGSSSTLIAPGRRTSSVNISNLSAISEDAGAAATAGGTLLSPRANRGVIKAAGINGVSRRRSSGGPLPVDSGERKVGMSAGAARRMGGGSPARRRVSLGGASLGLLSAGGENKELRKGGRLSFGGWR